MVHVVGIRIDRAWVSRRRSRVVDPVPGDVGRIARIRIVRHEDAPGRRRRPQCSMVGLVTRDPRDRPTRAVGAVHGAGQVARIV